MASSSHRWGLAWSPDDQWIALIATTENEAKLLVLRADGSEGPYEVATLPEGLSIERWEGTEPAHVASVRAEPSVLELASGEGRRVQAPAFTPGGEVLPVPIRWSVVDSTVATVDELGFIRGRRPGSTSVIASAGGLYNDTITVTTSFANVDTVFVENWSQGIDEAHWRPYGQPRPQVVEGPGRAVFWNNGDYNHMSGAVLTRDLLPGPDGFTIEVDGWIDMTGEAFQDWVLFMTGNREASLDPEVGGDYVVDVAIWGADPAHGKPNWAACASGPDRRQEDVELDELNRRWFRTTVQVRPDTVVECYLDGELLSRGRISSRARWGEPLWLILSGRAEGARIYHGQVTITRGLRY